MKNLGTIFLLILSGAFMALSYPIRYEGWHWDSTTWGLLTASVGILLFIPLSLHPEKAKTRFLFGFLGGLSFFSIVIYWVAYALHHFGDIPLAISVLAMLLLAAYCALFLGVWSAVSGSQMIKEKTPLLKIICWASLWTALEALRQWIFTGFSWGELGYAFSFLPWLSRTASIWGAHGLTFIWILVAGILLHIRNILDRSLNPREWGGLLGGLIVLGSLGVFFYPSSPAVKVKVGVIQPNISQELKWDPDKAENHFSNLLELSNSVLQKGADLVIWPETSLPYSLLANQRELPFSSSRPLIFGAVIRDGMINRNAAVLMNENQIIRRFDKIHLVPFGEYVPFKDLIPFGKLVQNAGDFLPGSIDQPLLQVDTPRINAGPLICYEDIFSRSSVAHARKGANLLVNLTNDAWYGPTSAQAQHAMIASMQVYQTGIPMIRATNNGLSTFITPFQRTDIENSVSAVGVEDITLAENPKLSFFVLTYPLMEWIFIFIFVIALLWKNPSQKKRIFFRKSSHY